MAGRRWVIGACVMLAGCNLLSGAADLVTGADDGGPGGAGSGLEGGATSDGEAIGPDGNASAFADGNEGAVGSALDASSDANDAALPPRPDAGRFVFVTSGQMTGNLDGVTGADLMCEAIATDAGLGGTWMAWVSTPVSGAALRLTSAGPWYLLTGALVATSKAELGSAAMLAHPIDRDELAAMRINSLVWTGGSLSFETCTSWTSAAVGTVGITGNTQFSTSAWQATTTQPCTTAHRLYCFEN